MDLKEIKKLVHFARRAGVKTLTVNGMTVEFKDEIIIQKPRAPRLVKSDAKESQAKAPEIPVVPSLDEINKFIYEQQDEAG